MAREARRFVDEAFLLEDFPNFLLFAGKYVQPGVATIIPSTVQIARKNTNQNGLINKKARFARHFCPPFLVRIFSSNLDNRTTGTASQLSTAVSI